MPHARRADTKEARMSGSSPDPDALAGEYVVSLAERTPIRVKVRPPRSLVVALTQLVAPRTGPAFVVSEANGAVKADGIRALNLVGQRVDVDVKAVHLRCAFEASTEGVLLVNGVEAMISPQFSQACCCGCVQQPGLPTRLREGPLGKGVFRRR